jgi:hypothetical protein
LCGIEWKGGYGIGLWGDCRLFLRSRSLSTLSLDLESLRKRSKHSRIKSAGVTRVATSKLNLL